jgi:hypothetical protein
MIADTINEERSWVKRMRWNGRAGYLDGGFLVFVFAMTSGCLLRSIRNSGVTGGDGTSQDAMQVEVRLAVGGFGTLRLSLRNCSVHNAE